MLEKPFYCIASWKANARRRQAMFLSDRLNNEVSSREDKVAWATKAEIWFKDAFELYYEAHTSRPDDYRVLLDWVGV